MSFLELSSSWKSLVTTKTAQQRRSQKQGVEKTLGHNLVSI